MVELILKMINVALQTEEGFISCSMEDLSRVNAVGWIWDFGSFLEKEHFWSQLISRLSEYGS